ncbi:transketolase [bacterium]|nr:transketolase [bacterium]
MEMIPTRDGYGEGLVELGEKNEKVVVLCCDLTESTRSQAFVEAFPERFVEVGIQEQNMAGLATGMAMSGYIPFIASYSVFSPGRNWDQVRISICYTNANVKIAGAHAGISVGPDGATHQALEDIALTRVLPNMTVIVPCDVHETRKATISAAETKGPMYVRFGRADSAVITAEKSPFEIGVANILAAGSDVTIIACGPLVYQALEAARELAKSHKIKAEVINNHTIKPIDTKTLVSSAKKTKAVVTVEEHQIHGGLGSAVAEVLSSYSPVPMRFVGMPDLFGESGEPEELLEKYGMTKEKIIASVSDVIKNK